MYEEFDAFFTSFQREALHLEMRDFYGTADEIPHLRKWEAGEPDDADWLRIRLDTPSEAAAVPELDGEIAPARQSGRLDYRRDAWFAGATGTTCCGVPPSGFPAPIYSRDKTRLLTGLFAFFALLRVAICDDVPHGPPEVLVVFDGEHGAAGRRRPGLSSSPSPKS
ncbi:MAG: DUF6879 family protein [Sciscionella sp.]